MDDLLYLLIEPFANMSLSDETKIGGRPTRAICGHEMEIADSIGRPLLHHLPDTNTDETRHLMHSLERRRRTDRPNVAMSKIAPSRMVHVSWTSITCNVWCAYNHRGDGHERGVRLSNGCVRWSCHRSVSWTIGTDTRKTLQFCDCGSTIGINRSR